MQCDVLVAGGGSAGLAAGIAAARAGAKTLLIEHHGSLGGMATASLIHSICGLYKISSAPEPIWANEGFPKEFATCLMRKTPNHPPIRMGKVDVLLTQPTDFALVADELTSGTRNLRVLLHSTIIRAASPFGNVEVYTRGRTSEIRAGCVVDATGDGTVAALAGAAFEQSAPERLQRPAFIFTMQGIATSALGEESRLKIARHLASAVKRSRLPLTAMGATLRSSPRAGEAYVSLDLPGLPDYDPLDAGSLTHLEMQGRSTAVCLAHFLRDEVAGFDASFISAFPTRAGIRESRRVVGKYRLESSDLENGATFPDSIGLATWPMELRETATGPRLRYPVEDRPCEIPLRCLQARDHANLFLAGRCISASHEAQASIRVIGTCLATGEAAGIAAARFIRGKECNEHR